MADKEFNYTIVDEIGILSTTAKGWKKELNLVSWNGREPKYDIRDWSPDHEKMGKGVTLSEDEIKELKNILIQIASSNDAGSSKETITEEELIEHWNKYIDHAPEQIRIHLAGTRLNKLKKDTVVVCLQKGGTYNVLSEQSNRECLSKFVRDLLGKRINVELLESSWI